MGDRRPPALARALTRLWTRGDRREVLLGDLAEGFHRRLEGTGELLRARRWYWRQVLGSGRDAVLGALRAGRGRGRGRRRPGRPGTPSRPDPVAELGADVRFTLRSLRRTPGFALLAMGTLAAGIGAATAAFSVVDAVLLRPLPYPDADRLVVVRHEVLHDGSLALDPVSLPDFADYRAASSSFTGLATYTYGNLNVVTGDQPLRVLGYRVSPGFFEVLGRAPLRGSLPDGHEPVVVASHAFWRQNLGGREDVIGRTVRVNGTAHVVAAVMPPGVLFPDPKTALWIPRESDPGAWPRDFSIFSIVGRLADGVAARAADRELDAIAGRLAARYPDEVAAEGVAVTPLPDLLLGPSRLPLWTAAGAVFLLLTIGCANVAGLLLARGLRRRGELALRVSLGATRGRLVRQLLTESLVLAGAGAGLGLALAGWLLRAVRSLAPGDLPRLADASVDLRAVAVASAVALVAAALCGVVPALRSSRAPASGMGARGPTPGRGARRLRVGLVAFEVALAVVLLVGSSLLVGTFLEVSAVDPGFVGDRVLSFGLSLDSVPRDRPEQAADLVATLQERLAGLPGVEAVGATLQLPVVGWDVDLTRVTVEGRVFDPGREPTARLHVVTPGLFETLQVPLVAGRALVPGDDAAAPGVVVVSEEFVRRYLPDTPPVGQRISTELVLLPSDPPVRTIVGVVGDVRHFGPRSPHEPQVYVPHRQTPWPAMNLVLRAASDPLDLAAAVREQVRQLDPDLPVADLRVLGTALDDAVAPQRFRARLVAGVAAAALALALIGVWGTVAQRLAEQRREIGIRLALGAARADVLALVIRQAMLPVAVGVAAGLVAARAAAAVSAGLLFRVGPGDPGAYLLAAAAVLLVAAAASLVLAGRAADLDPRGVLR